jgi:hypothetical protein
MHTLMEYNDSGILIVTPEDDLSADRQALNPNFMALAGILGDVPYLYSTSYSLTNTGTGITVVSGPNGNAAISFPGTASLFGGTVFSGSSPVVLAVAVKVNTQQNNAGFAGTGDFSTAYGSFSIQSGDSTPNSTWYGLCYGDDVNSGVVQDTNWHVLALVWDGTTFTLYLDGLNKGSTTPPLDIVASDFWVGSQNDQWFSDADIGDVVVLNGVPGALAGFLSDLHTRWLGGGDSGFDPTSYGVPCTLWLNPNQGVATDGSGNVVTWKAQIPSVARAVTVDYSEGGYNSSAALSFDSSANAYFSQNLVLPNLPTSSAGLPNGALYNDGGFVKVV